MNIPLLHGLRDVTDRYDAFFIDIYGVIHDGLKLFPGTKDCLENLKAAGKAVCLLSNTARRRHETRDDLAAMGLPPDLYTAIVTAGDSAHDSMKKYRGKTCWYTGTDENLGLIEGHGIAVQDAPESAHFVLNTIPGTEFYDENDLYKKMDRAVTLRLPMICADPDLVVNIGNRQVKCGGTFALYYEQRGGQVEYHGKPHAPVYEAAWEFLGKPDKSRLAGIGDALHTDMQGANRFSIDGILNLDGIHGHEVRDPGGIPDPGKLARLVASQEHKPSAALNTFAW